MDKFDMNEEDEFEYEFEDEVNDEFKEALQLIDFHELTAEEKEQQAKELAEKGFLPKNEELDETPSSPQEMVEKNPRKFIIEECIPACQELWSKNIYTFMVSDHLNEGECWIEIILDGLSDENKEIYANLSGSDVIKFSYHPGAINFGVKAVGKEGQAKLLELAKQFKMQDVPATQAYISPQDFLLDYCGCYDEIPNPDYKKMTPPWSLQLPYEELMKYMDEYDEWENSSASKETIRKFNANKITKSLEELAEEHGMIVDEDRVYLSPFHYNKHLQYLKTLENSQADEVKPHSQK